ncbi:MAG: hypothetical protein LBK56_01810 [Gracilibacteraceae bacterium]|jgi:hypothetical protein|nr:hypothetical protein [Gracilibacteraceae bacterium]
MPMEEMLETLPWTDYSAVFCLIEQKGGMNDAPTEIKRKLYNTPKEIKRKIYNADLETDQGVFCWPGSALSLCFVENS